MSSFNQSLVELMFLASKIGTPGERVRVTEWIKRLATESQAEGSHPRLVQEYVEYLKLMLSGSPVYFVEPFATFPPKNGQKLLPLAELLGNSLANACPYLPRSGQLAPVVLHSAGDDTSMISVQRDADGEIYCYMAIAPRND
ncbi:uncharacterized protein LOC119767955 [Culex quinquefasciatus]|uniref:uncharacterized protein LOC119767955 n=1 Tax=Culex quinquefasciatus TaxID=7176 RepID=UPI0018E3E5FF|nr:uncharacterized protein LOC119767955 [Culex quinquefasciatus]